MMTSKELNNLGLPHDPQLMRLGMKVTNSVLAHVPDWTYAGKSGHEAMREAIRDLCVSPEHMADHETLGPLAKLFMELYPKGPDMTPRESPTPGSNGAAWRWKRRPCARWKRPVFCP